MKYLSCPQCELTRFFIKKDNEFIVFQITVNGEIHFIYSENKMQIANDTIISCLGCSWKGTINQLMKVLTP